MSRGAFEPNLTCVLCGKPIRLIDPRAMTDRGPAQGMCIDQQGVGDAIRRRAGRR